MTAKDRILAKRRQLDHNAIWNRWNKRDAGATDSIHSSDGAGKRSTPPMLHYDRDAPIPLGDGFDDDDDPTPPVDSGNRKSMTPDEEGAALAALAPAAFAKFNNPKRGA